MDRSSLPALRVKIKLTTFCLRFILAVCVIEINYECFEPMALVIDKHFLPVVRVKFLFSF